LFGNIIFDTKYESVNSNTFSRRVNILKVKKNKNKKTGKKKKQIVQKVYVVTVILVRSRRSPNLINWLVLFYVLWSSAI